MRNLLSIIGCAVAAFFILTPVQAQNYVPIDPAAKSETGKANASTKNLVTERLGLDLFRTDIKSLAALPADKAAAFPECSPVPSINDVSGSLDYRRTLLSSSAAIKLGIPVVNVSTTGNQMVLVQDYSRTKECLASDNQTRLLYGQTIRTIITIANFDAQANLTLPAIAASATIGGKSNSLQIQILGFSNPQIPIIVSGISGKELNVETYGEFAKIHSELIRLTADAATTPSMTRLGIVTVEEPDNLKSNVVAAFALQQIKDGKSCNDAKANYRQPSEPSANAIDQTYGFVMSTCSSVAPNAEHKAKALDYLQGLKIKYSIL
ncbi:hypothetical protein ACIPIN_02980 [Pseudomonas sp. NPDC087697]|uniref:hypothetical protein n=1 Tax=Pseudomonas sp. NPDC087697 TaxID=3364447 RepID=UPI003810E3BD